MVQHPKSKRNSTLLKKDGIYFALACDDILSVCHINTALPLREGNKIFNNKNASKIARVTSNTHYAA